MDSELLDVVQEHIDAAYSCNGDTNSDGIDWALAEKTAHEHLDKFVGFEAVHNAINWFKH